MKKPSVYLCFLLILSLLTLGANSCARKSGCAGVYDNVKPKLTKKGKPKKKASSGLFDKKMSKRVGGD